MWGHVMMNTLEAALSVVFIAIFLIEHGTATTTEKTAATINCTQQSQPAPFRSPYPVIRPVNNIQQQDPRFLGVRKGRNVSIFCECQLKHENMSNNLTWYLVNHNGTFLKNLILDEHITIEGYNLHIKKVQKKHAGIYVCNLTRAGTKILPCGTELIVLGYGSPASARARNVMKDAIIMIQTILIVLFISLPVLLLMEMKKKRTLKIEDHTYEGLEAYQSATYEDIQTVRVLASKTMEGEHPCLE